MNILSSSICIYVAVNEVTGLEEVNLVKFLFLVIRLFISLKNYKLKSHEADLCLDIYVLKITYHGNKPLN